MLCLLLLFCAAASAQEKKEYQGQFVVTDVPVGEAPFAIRKQWKDLVLPFKERSLCGIGVLSNAFVPALYGYLVPQEVAIEILRHKSPETAQWWEAQGYPEK